MSQQHTQNMSQKEKPSASNGVRYILDFDGVIFDTEALKKKMAELGIEESERSSDLFDQIKEKDPTFEIPSLLFEDARIFLEKHASECVIVSSFVSTNPFNNQDEETQRLYQEMKINLSGVAATVGAEHVHVVGQSKASVLAELKEQFDTNGHDCVFIDDRKVYVEEATELGIKTFWMNKKKGQGHPEHIHEGPTNEINSFLELESYLETWKK